MQFQTAVQILKGHETDLNQMGVRSLYMFGSTVTGSQKPDSDVDLFFDHDPESLDLIGLIDIQNETSRLLGCKADIMTRTSIHPGLRARIETSAVQIF